MDRFKMVNLIYKIKKILNKDFRQEVYHPEVNSIQINQEINYIVKSNKTMAILSLSAHTIRINADPNKFNIKTSILNKSHINSNSNGAALPWLKDLK